MSSYVILIIDGKGEIMLEDFVVKLVIAVAVIYLAFHLVVDLFLRRSV